VTGARQIPSWIVTAKGAKTDAFNAAGVETITVDAQENIGFSGLAATALGERGLSRVLVEGGGTLAATLVSAGLIDEIYWFCAGKMLGNDGLPAVGMLKIAQLAQTPGFKRRATLDFGGDTLDILDRI
jgi:diaminohydroxyphosphoribosylaminopyrimidine deaminase/5-amino-6-(5-phosphoribosylamino)uracil reductase